MGRWIVSFVLIFVFSICLTSGQSIDAPIKKMTHYASLYEMEGISYAQLIVYMASLDKELAIEMGAALREHDQLLTREQLEKALGTPAETTMWVWDENAQEERKVDDGVPAWRENIFDGRELQVSVDAWPNLRDDKIIYRLHSNVNFKSSEAEIDIKGEIERVKLLAQDYASSMSRDKLQSLAEEAVSVEQSFNNNQYEGSVKCEEQMNELFGSENKRETQKVLRQEIDFYEEDKLQAFINLEMCDDCGEWRWINMHMQFEARDRKFKYPEENRNYDENSKDRYAGFSNEEFKEETKNILSEVRAKLEEKDYQTAMNKMQEIKILTDRWNENANDVWQEVEALYKVDFDSMTQEEREECSKTYCWMKKEQERRRAEKELRNKNYEERREFYLELFADYDKKESRSSQEQWEKRLVEEFREFGEEICSNNLDDNNDQQIDCGDSQCSGKVCGYDTIIVDGENGLQTEQKRESYCIAGTCQAKEEIVAGPVCGNNICEENEQEMCASDCVLCVQHEALACDGTAIFSGQDTQSCPLEPICMVEDLSCEIDDDCTDPLCADHSCVEGTCQFVQLTECRESECTDGEEKIQNCNSGNRLIIEKCIAGIWRDTNLDCLVAEETPETGEVVEETPETGETSTDGTVGDVVEEIAGNACVVRSDCGNENDVCENGNCVMLPEIIEDVDDEAAEQEIEIIVDEMIASAPEPEIPEEFIGNEQNPLTGNVVANLFRNLITGFQVEGGENPEPETQSANSEPPQLSPGPEQSQQPEPELSPVPDFTEQQEYREKDDREERERQDQERRALECSERCGRECYDMKVRPCVENALREKCGNEFECDIDAIRIESENTCKENAEVASCITECTPKCLSGANTWVEPEKQEHKQEKFVFTVGGACMQQKEMIQRNIWFGGWGDEFKDFHRIKEQYYTWGGTDWCEREYKNLIHQRRELEKSFDKEFAAWFFGEHLANSAEDWEKQVSGVFDIYWRTVDLWRQTAERAQCIGITELPPYEPINLEYDTVYGKMEFWEEETEADVFGDGEKVKIVSPFMRIYLSPPREFYKIKMREAMEMGMIPGPEEEDIRNTPTEEQKQRLIEEGDLDRVREFRDKYGDSLVIQLKDFNTDEVVFNVYIQLNEEDIMNFVPMPPAEIPVTDYVSVVLDADKLLDMIEYGDSGRVELHSPPWDKKPEVGFVKNVVDGVKMYFMFKEMMNSAVVTPSDAEADALDLTKLFFEFVMNGGDEERREGPESEEFEKEQQKDSEKFQEDN